MVDMIQDDRPRFRGDPAGEALADRTHALPDFLLQPARRRGDEVPAGTVQQQHRRGVRVQAFLHPAHG
ncbi:MAG: hypothetical protein ABR922_04990 [Streptosporangiaceae bacterium]